MKTKLNLFWFRRDLRLIDNHGLYEALQSELPVLPIFIFDTNILDKLENKEDKRVDFIFQALEKLNEYLEKSNKSIQIFYGKPLEIYENLSQQYEIGNVFCNEDYEPYAIKRDQEIKDFLASKNINFYQFKDGAKVILKGNQIKNADLDAEMVRISNTNNAKNVSFEIENETYNWVDGNATKWTSYLLYEDDSAVGKAEDYTGININIKKKY